MMKYGQEEIFGINQAVEKARLSERRRITRIIKKWGNNTKFNGHRVSGFILFDELLEKIK